jgi:outer membrane protein OmpA-like peptidoglycan-associated protein
MSSPARCALLLSLILGLGAPMAEEAPPAETGAKDTSFDDTRARLLARIKERWSDQIQRSTTVQDEAPIDVAGADGTPTVHGGYVATSPRNPLIDEGCRAESLADAVAHWGKAQQVSEDEAFTNRENHIRDLQGELASGSTFSAWIGHVAKCKDFCLIAVRDLLACHVKAVASLPHALVYFATDSDRVQPGPHSTALDDFATRLNGSPAINVLLIGRASRIGAAGPSYNRALSQRRAQSVADALAARGVPSGRIQVQAIGYEEPQITDAIAEIYGISDDFRRLGEDAINQSVVMVIY